MLFPRKASDEEPAASSIAPRRDQAPASCRRDRHQASLRAAPCRHGDALSKLCTEAAAECGRVRERRRLMPSKKKGIKKQKPRIEKWMTKKATAIDVAGAIVDLASDTVMERTEVEPFVGAMAKAFDLTEEEEEQFLRWIFDPLNLVAP